MHLQAFKDRHAIVQRADAWLKCDGSVGLDACSGPLVAVILSAEHVVAEDATEGHGCEVDSGKARLCDAVHGNRATDLLSQRHRVPLQSKSCLPGSSADALPSIRGNRR